MKNRTLNEIRQSKEYQQAKSLKKLAIKSINEVYKLRSIIEVDVAINEIVESLNHSNV